MFTISTRRIAAALAGPAVIAGVLGGALALGAPANAQPVKNDANCSTSRVAAAPPNTAAFLTRAGQLNVVESREPVTATSCIGH